MSQAMDDPSVTMDAPASPLLPPAATLAVALQLPDFWLHDAPSWFVHMEDRCTLHGISADDTKFHHVVASLDPLSTHRAMTILRVPPAHRKYDGGFLFIHLFLRQLPVAMKTGIANSPFLAARDYRSLAEEADRILLASRTFQTLAVDPPTAPPPASPIAADLGLMAGIATQPHRWKDFCFYHQCFGTIARRCLPPCYFPAQEDRAASTVAVANDTERLLFIEDSRSGGLCVLWWTPARRRALFRWPPADRLAADNGPWLIAANGSPIASFRERLVTVSFHGQDFQWNFVVSASSVPILGADFLCAHGLLVDVAQRLLINALLFSSLPCFTWTADPLIWANLVASGDVFHRLLLEFPLLSVPNFSSTVTKHGVEHYIPTISTLPRTCEAVRHGAPGHCAVLEQRLFKDR